MRADAALKAIHHALFEIVLANENGVRSGLDGEFLHDFRVATRRTRTGLRQLPGVYPKGAARGFAAEFRWLAQTTNAARDLEVYLRSLDSYGQSHEAVDLEALTPLVSFLRERQSVERVRCTEALDSDRYEDLKGEWTAFLDGPEPFDDTLSTAGLPVLPVACERIWKAYRRVVRRGRKITAESPAKRFHRLRLQCKKLRYLLEFFHSLFDEQDADSAILALKEIQDVLGDLNDIEVQLGWIERFRASPSPPAAQQPAATAKADDPGVLKPLATVAVEDLCTLLEARRVQQRSHFAEVFVKFSSRANETAYRILTEPRDAQA